MTKTLIAQSSPEFLLSLFVCMRMGGFVSSGCKLIGLLAKASCQCLHGAKSEHIIPHVINFHHSDSCDLRSRSKTSPSKHP